MMSSKLKPGLDNLTEKDIGPTTPLRLEIAARLAFPDGSMKVSGLRREIARGRLTSEMIAGKLYTTLGDIDAMRTLCRRPVNEQVHREPRVIGAEIRAQMRRQSKSREAVTAQQHLRALLDRRLEKSKKKRSKKV